MEAVEPRAPHGDRVAGPGQRRREKQRVADVLRGADRAPRAPDDADRACRNQDQADALLEGESFFQDHGGEDRHHQRHHAGKQRAGMGCGSKQQTCIHQQDHRRPAAGHDGGDAEPAKAVKRQSFFQRIRQQQQAGDSEADGRDIPRRQARAHAEPRHDDKAGPDAHRSEAIEGAAHVVGCRRFRHAVDLKREHPDSMGLFSLNPTRVRTERTDIAMNSAGSAFAGTNGMRVRVDLGQTCSTPPVAVRHPIPDGELPFTSLAPVSRRNTASIFAGSRGGEFGNEGRPCRREGGGAMPWPAMMLGIGAHARLSHSFLRPQQRSRAGALAPWRSN